MDTLTYITLRRLFIFFDEWLSYLSLFIIYNFYYQRWLFVTCTFMATLFNLYGYISFWSTETKILRIKLKNSKEKNKI